MILGVFRHFLGPWDHNLGRKTARFWPKINFLGGKSDKKGPKPTLTPQNDKTQ